MNSYKILNLRKEFENETTKLESAIALTKQGEIRAFLSVIYLLFLMFHNQQLHVLKVELTLALIH